MLDTPGSMGGENGRARSRDVRPDIGRRLRNSVAGPASPLGTRDRGGRGGPSSAAPGQSLPQPLQIHRAERAVVEAVPGASALAPNHAAVVGAHRPSEANIAQRSQYLAQVQATTCRDRKSTRLNSSHITISYAVFC